MTLSPSPPISRSRPLAEQIRDLLQQRILREVYPPEARMPSEERLAQELNVSRATVRTAMAALAAEGLVLRKHGDGTYPAPHTLEIALHAQEAWNIERQILHSGRKPASKILSAGFRESRAEEAAKLGLQSGSRIYAIRRLFLADELPVMLASYALRSEGLKEAIPAEAVRGSLLEFMEQFQLRQARSGVVLFKAILAEPDLAQPLQVSAGSPLLLLEANVRDETGQPLLAAWEYYLGHEGFLLPLAPLRP
jgi:DNA-binding GntR family transcriptional regulator